MCRLVAVVADLQFECIATWRDGSDQYLYGQFSGPEIDNKRESYRCFVSTVFYFSLHASLFTFEWNR